MSKRKIGSTSTINDDDKDDSSKDKADTSNGGNIKRSRSSRPSAIANIKDEESDDEPAPSDVTLLTYQNNQLYQRLVEKNREIHGLRHAIDAQHAARDQYERTMAVVTRHWDQLNQDLHTLIRSSCAPSAIPSPEPLSRPDPATAKSFDELLLMSQRPSERKKDENGTKDKDKDKDSDKGKDKDEKDTKKGKGRANGRAPAKRRKSNAAAAAEAAENESKAKEEENEEFEAKQVNAEDELIRRSAFTKQITTSLTDALMAQQRASSAVFALLRSNDGNGNDAALKSLKANHDRLRAQNEELQQSLEDLKQQHNEVHTNAERYRERMLALRLEAKTLANERDDKNVLLTRAQRKIDRLVGTAGDAADESEFAATLSLTRAPTLALPGGAPPLSSSTSSSSTIATPTARSSSTSPLPPPVAGADRPSTPSLLQRTNSTPATPLSSSGAPMDADSIAARERLETLERELADLKTELNDRNSEADTLRNEKSTALAQLAAVESRPPSDDLVLASAPYHALKQKLDLMAATAATKVSAHEKLMRELIDSRNQRERDADSHAQTATNEATKFNDVAQRYEQQLRTSDEKMQAAIRDKEEHVNRCKADGHDHIDRKLIAELKSQVDRQGSELSELRAANEFNRDGENKRPTFLLFQRWKKSEQELQARYAECQARLSAVTAPHSSSTRDVADARAAEAKLRVEIQSLRSEVEGLRTASSSIADLQAQVEAAKEEVKALSESMDGLAAQYEESDSANRRLVTLQAERDAVQAKLVQDNLLAKQQLKSGQEQVEKEKKTIAAMNTLMNARIVDLAMHETAIKQLRTLQSKQDENIIILKEHIKNIAIERDDARKVAMNTQTVLSTEKKAYSQLQEKLEEELKEKEKIRGELSALKTKYSLLRTQSAKDVADARSEAKDARAAAAAAAKLGGASKGGKAAVERKSDTAAELDIAKSRLKCSVCSKRDKEVVITKCYHMFCKECIDANLKTRHRKCPGCNVTFGANDVRDIYL